MTRGASFAKAQTTIKHHTTVMHSIGKIDEQRRTDKDLHHMLTKLQEMLNG